MTSRSVLLPLLLAASLAGAQAPTEAAAPTAPTEPAATEKTTTEPAPAEPAASEPAAPEPTPALAPAPEAGSWLDEIPMKIGVFADVGGVVADSGEPPGFFIGQFDIFITGGVGRWRLLTEVVVEQSHGTASGVGVDVERVQVRYAHRDWLNVTAGRLHQRIGHYNATFHHGAFLQTTANRPTIIGFEDEAGFLPVHLVGLEVDGRVPVGDFAFSYVVGLGNGRSSSLESIAQAGDGNLTKGVAGQLRVDYEPWGLGLGVGLLYDRIPTFTTLETQVRLPGLDETIASAFAVLDLGAALLIVEGYGIRHGWSGGQYTTLGGFAEFSYGFDWVRPYARLEGITFGAGERSPYFEALLTTGNQVSSVLGVKFEINSHVVFRIEAQRDDRALAAPRHSATAQFAISL